MEVHGSVDGAAEETGEDSSGLDGGLDGDGNFFEHVLSSLEDITYLLGEIADYYRSGAVPGSGGGVSPHAGFGGSLNGGFGGAFSGGSGLGYTANVTDQVDSFTAAWGWDYNKSVAKVYANSPAGWLRSLNTSVTNLNSFWRTPVQGYYVTTLIYYIFDRLGVQNTRTSNIYDLMAKQWGAGYGGTKVTYDGSPADNLEKIRALLLSKVDDGYFTTWIYYIYDNGLKIREQNDRLYSFLSSQYDGRYFTTTVGYIYNALVANGNLVSKGFSDMLDKLGSLSVSVDFDLSGVESRLDSVIRLLTAAGVVENSKDFFGAILGDLSLPSTASAIGSIKDVLSTAFPFCIPSVVNLVLFGSVVADPQAPCWEFDIAGSPLVVDFAPYEDFAEVCRWTVRLLFVAALLLNTRKFVYGMGGGQA